MSLPFPAQRFLTKRRSPGSTASSVSVSSSAWKISGACSTSYQGAAISRSPTARSRKSPPLQSHPRRRHQRQRLRLRHDRFDLSRARISHRPLHIPSPRHFRERIRVNGEMISEDAVANGLTTIRNLVADWDPHPTFFEVTTALALKHFSEAENRRGHSRNRHRWAP